MRCVEEQSKDQGEACGAMHNVMKLCAMCSSGGKAHELTRIRLRKLKPCYSARLVEPVLPISCSLQGPRRLRDRLRSTFMLHVGLPCKPWNYRLI